VGGIRAHAHHTGAGHQGRPEPRPHLLLALDGWDTQDGGVTGNPSIVVSKSADQGDTWQPVVARDNRSKVGEQQEGDRPVTGIAVDAKTGKDDLVYVGASRRSPGFTGGNSLPNQPEPAAGV
jgi:hypothetical protein